MKNHQKPLTDCRMNIFYNQFMTESKELAGYLVIQHNLQPQGKTNRIPFYFGVNIIGRVGKSATMVIDDASISAKHAKLIVTPESMRIIDLDSKNGIKMNSSGNTLAKNTQFAIDESMNIFLADIKCKFQRIPPKEICEETMIIPIPSKQEKKIDILNIFSDEFSEKQPKPSKPTKQHIIKQKVNDEFSITSGFAIAGKKDDKSNGNSKSVLKNAQKSKKQKKSSIIQREEPSSLIKNLPIKQDKKEVIQTKKVPGQSKKSIRQIQQSKRLQPSQQQPSKKRQLKKNKQEKQQNYPKARGILKNEEKVDKKLKQSKQKQKKISQKPKSKEKQKQIERSKTKQQSKSNNRQLSNQISRQKRKSKRLQFRQKQQTHISIDKNREIKSLKVPNNKQRDQQGAKTKIRRSDRRRLPIQSKEQEGMLNRRRSFAYKRVMFSGFIGVLTKKYFNVVESIQDQFDFLIMKQYKRTYKALYAICKGCLIIRYDWIKQSQFLQKTLKPENYHFKNIDYVYEGIQKVNKGFRVFKGYQFYLASSEYHLKIPEIEILVYAAGGEMFHKVGKLSPKQKEQNNKIAIVRSYQQKYKENIEQDYKSAKKMGFQRIYTLEMILNSCERQQIDWDAFKASKL